ncbi:MAG TPA: T9SS type A sorting domain-containing protein [Chitinophagaceae bacterium]|nr:T9SS type A sorting domain-containing protein [Chitinophagaceae bacterium]
MKRALLLSVCLLFAALGFSQLQEDFDPSPSGWILSQGANFQTITTNGGVVTPGVGGNNPAVIGTPGVNKTSNTFEVCFDVFAYTSNLNSQIPFPCNTYVDVLFVKSTVANANDAVDPLNILYRVDNYLLPTSGGNTCFNFTFPASVTDPTFKVFLSFHADCQQGGIKYFVDNINISGVNLICGGANCPPGASNDNFNRGPSELSFNGVLYGSPIDVSFPAPAPGYAVDATGTDGDQNDDYNHLRWSVVTPPVNGTVVVNADGTMTVTRNSVGVTQLTFTYRLTDDGPDNNFTTTGDNMLSNIATVVVNWPSGATTPVTMSSFTAIRNKNVVSLKWETQTESNNTGFEILRSTDNNNFEKIGFVASKASGGNSSTKLNYDFSDISTSKGITLYRLRQVDADGKSQYTPIKSVRGEGMQSNVVVYPNPSTTGDVSISVTGITNYNVHLIDMRGRIMKEYSKSNGDLIKIYGLQSGMYMVKVTDINTGEQSSQKIVVNKR